MAVEQMLGKEKMPVIIPSFPNTARITHEHSNFINQVNNSIVTPLKREILSGFDPIDKVEMDVVKYTNPLTGEIHSNPKAGVRLPICDTGLLSLLVYNTQPGIRISELNGNMVLRMLGCKVQEAPYYTFTGQNAVPETIHTLLERSITEGLGPKLKRIPYTSIQPHYLRLKEEFNIEEDRDSFDYVYRIEDFVHQEGKKYKHIRNMRSKFEREMVGRDARTLFFKNQDIRPIKGEIREVMKKWRSIRSKPKEEVDNLLNVMERFSTYSKDFNMYNMGLLIDGKLSAFSFNEVINNKYVISRFFHADKYIPGVAQHLDYKLMERLYMDGFEYINLEDDLGKEGLRQFKMGYQPAFFLKKYTISPKQ